MFQMYVIVVFVKLCIYIYTINTMCTLEQWVHQLIVMTNEVIIYNICFCLCWDDTCFILVIYFFAFNKIYRSERRQTVPNGLSWGMYHLNTTGRFPLQTTYFPFLQMLIGSFVISVWLLTRQTDKRNNYHLILILFKLFWYFRVKIWRR